MTRRAWLVSAGRVPYDVSYRAMHELAARRAAGEIPDLLILLEHPPVFTAGRRTDPSHLRLARGEIERKGAEVREVDRGGSVTFHGPGQLVGYPIVHLGPRGDVLRYLRDIEETMIRAGGDLGVELERNRDTGVWSGDRKVCAIGVRVSRGVTLHGFALNCTTDLSWYGAIVPCGLEDRGVTSLSQIAGRAIRVAEAAPVVAARFAEVFGVELEGGPPDVEAMLTAPRPAVRSA